MPVSQPLLAHTLMTDLFLVDRDPVPTLAAKAQPNIQLRSALAMDDPPSTTDTSILPPCSNAGAHPSRLLSTHDRASGLPCSLPPPFQNPPPADPLFGRPLLRLHSGLPDRADWLLRASRTRSNAVVSISRPTNKPGTVLGRRAALGKLTLRGNQKIGSPARHGRRLPGDRPIRQTLRNPRLRLLVYSITVSYPITQVCYRIPRTQYSALVPRTWFVSFVRCPSYSKGCVIMGRVSSILMLLTGPRYL